MKKPENPQAFPTHDQDPGSDPRNRVLTGGMSLRDWFAGMALQGIVANPEASGSIEEIAHYSYRYADAMLAERAKGAAE